MEKKKYSKEFKEQLVALYHSGKSQMDITREYELSSHSLICTWIKQYEKSGSFKLSENLSPLEKELLAVKKRNKQLEMENDILKQAALIMGRK